MTPNTEIHSLLQDLAALGEEQNLGPVMVERIKRAREGVGESVSIPRACQKCGLGDIEVSVECHNSACDDYATSHTVFEGWKASAPPALDTAPRVGDDATEADDLLHSLNRDGSWLRAWRSAYKVGTHPDPSVVMQQIVEDIFWAVAFIEAKRALASIPTPTARAEALEECAKAFVEKVEALTPSINSMFQMAQIHGAVWKKEDNWVDEMAALKRALSSAPRYSYARSSGVWAVWDRLTTTCIKQCADENEAEKLCNKLNTQRREE